MAAGRPTATFALPVQARVHPGVHTHVQARTRTQREPAPEYTIEVQSADLSKGDRRVGKYLPNLPNPLLPGQNSLPGYCGKRGNLFPDPFRN